MSGFEIAGVVLGTFPLVVTAIEAYLNFMKDWSGAASELKSIHRQLTTGKSRLYNVCDQLLGSIVAQKDIEPMLKAPFGPLWQDPETNRRIRRRLWESYDTFEATVSNINEKIGLIK